VMKWRVIQENGGRRHAVPTPSELRQGQEDEEDDDYHFLTKFTGFHDTFRLICGISSMKILLRQTAHRGD
jgi:hypothetical protein